MAHQLCTGKKPCAGARQLSFEGDPSAVGLNIVDRVNIETHERDLSQIYRFPRKSEHKGHVWLNYCPWCGADLQFGRDKRAPYGKKGKSRGK